ncbi:MAG TPA: hypothetical protein VFI31_01970 [Pirellulales bacterium]|nr:hypothetical protein [Pirellulales bacterium]
MPADQQPMLELKPPRRPWLGLLAALSGLCIAVGFCMALLPGIHFLEWLALGFLGILGLCCAGYFLPGNSALVITAEGFTLRFASRAVFYPWSEVDYFAVLNRRVVAFRLYDTSERVSAFARRMTGYDGAFPSRYGSLPPDVLAARLNECREQFGPTVG